LRGYLTGRFLNRTPDRRRALSELLPAACLLIAAGYTLVIWLFAWGCHKRGTIIKV
jgi:predicted acyltransferase